MTHKKVTLLIVFGIFLFGIVNAKNVAGWFITGYCSEAGRKLSDRDFFEKAYAYEQKIALLPDEILKRSLDEIIESNPNCCHVERENNRFAEGHGWLDRVLLLVPFATIDIRWDNSATIIADQVLTGHLVTKCGAITDRFGFNKLGQN